MWIRFVFNIFNINKRRRRSHAVQQKYHCLLLCYWNWLVVRESKDVRNMNFDFVIRFVFSTRFRCWNNGNSKSDCKLCCHEPNIPETLFRNGAVSFANEYFISAHFKMCYDAHPIQYLIIFPLHSFCFVRTSVISSFFAFHINHISCLIKYFLHLFLSFHFE